MSPISKQFKKQNKLIRLGLGLLNIYSQDLDDQISILPENMRMSLYAMQTIYENCHLEFEEELLYPALLAVPSTDETIVKLRHEVDFNREEHEEIRYQFLAIRLSIDNYEAKAVSTESISHELGDLVNRLAQYIDREEYQLLPIAEKLLSDEQQAAILQMQKQALASVDSEELKSAKVILQRLRTARGMSAA